MLTLCQTVKAICKRKKISIALLEEQAGLGQNTIFTWDKVTPSADKILKVAQCLGVSTDSILGNDREIDCKNVDSLKPLTVKVIKVLEQTEISDRSINVVIDVIKSLEKNIDSALE